MTTMNAGRAGWAEALDRAARPLEEAWTLPPSAYTDPAVFELERERIFARSWIPVARHTQLAQPGDYVTLDLLGQPILVVHGEDGVIRALSAICLHRAAPIATGAGRRKLFTCPYHSWTYDTMGQLRRAPLMEGAKGFNAKACSLPVFQTEEWEGFILVNLDSQAPAFAPQVEGFRRHFEPFGMAGMKLVRTLDYDHGWNWKILVENFMEAYHHIGTHAGTLEPGHPAAQSHVPDSDGPWSILDMPASARAADGPPSLIPGLNPERASTLYAGALFPTFLLAMHGSGVIWYQMMPLSADRIELKINIMIPDYITDSELINHIAEEIALTTAAIHAEDIAINDTVWRGLNAPAARQGRLAPLEKAIWQFNNWWIDRINR